MGSLGDLTGAMVVVPTEFDREGSRAFFSGDFGLGEVAATAAAEEEVWDEKSAAEKSIGERLRDSVPRASVSPTRCIAAMSTRE